MLLSVPDVLTSEQVAHARQLLDKAEWIDGRVTAGYQSAKAKDNVQLRESDPAARQLGEVILAALGRNPLFTSAALPRHVFPPLFNRYSGGQSFGTHVDNAIRQVTGTSHRIRTDLSATLFLTGPDEYDGGELCVEDTYGGQRSLLFDLDLAIQRLSTDHPNHPSAIQLTGVYHNLLRQWAEI
jgi:PKHD-type hydroxylase